MKKPIPFIDLTRYAAFLALAIEVLDVFGRAFRLGLLDQYHDEIEKIGLLLFLISLVGWLEASKRSLAKLERVAAEVDSLAAAGQRMDLIGRYGVHAASLARLLYPQDGAASRFPHCRAGGETLSRLLLDIYGPAAQEFSQIMSGRSEIKLKEHSVINLFLSKLVESLPPGSAWLGISRLQDADAWHQTSAEASYYDFERTVESRVRDSSLTCFRLLCFEDRSRFAEMLPVALHQRDTGLEVRSFVATKLPTDLSLIWVPRTTTSRRVDTGGPIKHLESAYEPLCGLRFGIRGDREVDSMELFGATSDEFTELKVQFRANWSQGEAYENGRAELPVTRR